MTGPMWTAEKLFFSGDEYFSSIKEEIRKAQRSIDVESYIFDYDELGQSITEALIEAAQRGVRVHVSVDGIGSAYSNATLVKRFKDTRVEYRVYHPIFRSWFIPIFKTLNKRNHRKIWIFDQKIAFVGSFNISKVHTSRSHPPWRDSGMRVEGEDVDILTSAFEKVWYRKKIWDRKFFYEDSRSVSPLVRLNDSVHKRRASYRELLFRIRDAKKSIYFSNAYFAPHFRLVAELCYSARRGVEVHLLLPKKSDVFFMPWVGSTHYYALLQSGVKIHEYIPCVFHAKNYVVDDWMMIGSSNLNHRSLFYDLEVDLQVTHAENKQILLNELDQDLKSSELVTYKYFSKLSWIRQQLTRFFLLFKSWM